MAVGSELTLPLVDQLGAMHPGWHLGLGVEAMALAGCVCLPLLVNRLFRRKKEAAQRRQAELDMFLAARRDPLTQLAGRSLFLDKLSARLRAAAPSALLMIDIDRFSQINSKYGTRVGDEVLREMADRLRAMSPGTDLVARLGGDEFALLMPAPRGLSDAEAAAVSVLRSLTMPVHCAAGLVECSASLGVVLLPSQGEDTDEAMAAASAALSHVKEAGGASWRFFDPDRGAAERQRAILAEELRAGLERNCIVPYYQPIVDLEDGSLVGLEVLARWQHPTRGILPPDLFIPLAEEMQLAGQITQQLMRRVIADARDWPEYLYFAFNVSPGQLRELISMLRDPPNWPEGTIDPCRLEVEVTESALIEDVDVAREVIELLQAQGTRVVLDDFGIGYSNFFHLRELPFDRIKIDRSFVMDIATDPRAEAFVGAMLALAGSLGIPMVAEGIESADVEASVAALGCRYGQGYWFSEPVPANSVRQLVRRLKARAMAPIRIAS